MTKNPFLNALCASFYIIIVASVMYYGPKLTGHVDSFLVPVAILSLLVLSAAMMGYLFCYTPLTLYLDGHKKEALDLFLKTLGIFAGVTLFILCALFLFPLAL